MKNDVSGGFTMGAFIVAAGCSLVRELHKRHQDSGKCHCQGPWTMVDEEEAISMHRLPLLHGEGPQHRG